MFPHAAIGLCNSSIII